MTWWDRYIGIPFEVGGRSGDALDCWGLVREVYRSQRDIYLPDYGEISSTDLRSVARVVGVKRDHEPWRMVLEPREFDVAVMGLYNSRVPAHVGIMVDDERVLHTELASHVCVVSLRHPTVRERILGFRRHVALL